MPAPGLCAFSNKRKFFLLSSLLSQAGPAARMGAGLVLSQRGDWGPLSGQGTRSLTLGCPLGNVPCYLSRRGKEGGRNRSRAALLLALYPKWTPPAATAALSRHWVCLRFTLPAQTASLFPLCFSQGIWERPRCHPCAPTPSPPRKAGRKGPADASVAGNEPRPPKNNKQGLQGVGDRVSRGGVREDEGAPIYRLPSRHAPDSHTPSLLPPVAAALTGSGRHPRF